jgi:hypothetical protein
MRTRCIFGRLWSCQAPSAFKSDNQFIEKITHNLEATDTSSVQLKIVSEVPK